MVMRASSPPQPCCYKAVLDPPPGSWLSLNLNNSTIDDDDQPFCQEPDTSSSSVSSLPNPASDLASAFHSAQQTCDTIPSPAAKLNITASEIGTAWYNWRLRLQKHNLLNHSLSREGLHDDVNENDVEDDDDDNDVSFFSFDFLKKLFDWFSGIGGQTTASSSNETTLELEESSNETTLELEESSNATSSSSSSSKRRRTKTSLYFILTVFVTSQVT